jgi:hypothetical protein
MHVPDSLGELNSGESVLLKTFLVGIVLGLAAAAGALYAIPVVDQVREASIVTVAPNGGNTEVFHINIPMDRIMSGAPGRVSVPPDLKWPADEVLAGIRTELFKIRNARDAVVGVAVRAAAENGGEAVIDWVLHVPARGSMFVNMDVTPREGGFRIGQLRAGSQEFATLSGFMTEHWIVNEAADEDEPAGRIELQATYVGQLEALDPAESSE